MCSEGLLTNKNGGDHLELRTLRSRILQNEMKRNEENSRGVLSLLSRSAEYSLRDWTPISVKILAARYSMQARTFTYIQVHAPN